MGKVEWMYLKMIDADYSAVWGSPRKVLITGSKSVKKSLKAKLRKNKLVASNDKKKIIKTILIKNSRKK